MKKAIQTFLLLCFFFLPYYGFGQNSIRINDTVYIGVNSNRNLAPSRVGNGNGILNPTYFVQNVCGLNYVQASQLTETRSKTLGYNTNGTGFPTTVTVSGLPATCMVIQKAYLYYSASYTEATAPASTATVTNPVPATNTYAATTIGTGPAKGWGETGAAAYRADVTPIIAGNGVYTITVNGFANAAWEVDGVTLIIIYSSGPSANATGSLILIDGIISTSAANATETVSGFNVCAGTAASAFGLYSDMQANDNGNNNTDVYNATTGNFGNNFWNFNQLATPVVAAQNTTQFESYTNNGTNASDAYAWIMAGIYWHNTGCANCDPSIAFSNVNPTCGLSNGVSQAIVTGGTPPYTYTWTPTGGTSSNATGLSAGTYTVSVEDAICNTTTASVILTSTPSVTVNATATSNILCNGGTNGSASATITSGTSPYTYLWFPTGSTTTSISALSAGTYTIDVTDAKGCTGSATVVITQPPVIIASISSSVNELCNGGTNGSATVNVVGGTPVYTYNWTPGGNTNATATGLSAGTYTINIIDKDGCTTSASIIITQPPLLTATISAQTNLSCNGGNTGSASVTAGGGTPAYTYSWAPGGQTTTTITALSAGTYTITVQDANGCSSSAIVVISQPPPLAVSITSVVNISCNGANDGSETATSSGGNPAYTYLWTPGGNTNSSATGLSAGTYTITLTDASGCTATASAAITQPPPLTSAITASTNILCFGGNNGSATISAGGGTSPYTYLWTPGGNTNANATGLTAGTYTITVTDANGCVSTATIVLTQPNTINPTISAITNVSCNGGSNGSATVNVTGGSSPFTYLWSPGGNTNATATGLSAGTYTAMVTGAGGCSETVSVSIMQPAPITATFTATIGCSSGTGTASATISGGTPAYTYLWNPGGETTATITGLSAGTYTLDITDANGCTYQDSVAVTQPNALTASITDTNVLCNGGNTGSAIVTASGGTPAYTYLWAPGGNTTTTITGLGVGTYTIKVTDAAGCNTTASITITQPPILAETISVLSEVSCNSGSDGSAIINITGGTPTYTYDWLPGGNTGSSATGLHAGQYTVTVTDANGCQIKDSIVITQPPPLSDSLNINNTTCGLNNGSATVFAGGGTPGYAYSWSPGGQTTASVSGLSIGTYSVTITDANGCTLVVPVVINSTSANIFAGGNIFCSGGNTGTATITMTGGASPYTYSWSPGGYTTATVSGLTAGVYTVTITDSNGCIVTAIVTISQPPPLNTTITSLTNLACNSDSTGSATLTTTGGTAPYNYQWSPGGGNNATETGLGAGTYTVVVTDVHGCKDTVYVIISQPTALTLTISSGGQIPCFGGSGASATVTATGGTSPFTYLWYPGGGTSATITGLSAGKDSVVVMDANGCSGDAVITITQPPKLTDTIIAFLANCSNSNGSLTAVPSGGTSAYDYLWTPGGATTATISGLSAGTYTVTITDANGCTVSDSAIMKNAFDSLSAVSGVSCNGGNDGKATVTIHGGTSPFTYLWSPGGQTTATATGLSAGTYTINVTDSNACSITATVIITQPPPLTTTTIINNNVLCNGSSTGSATTSPAGGTSPYTYFWAPGGNNTANATGLSAGTYTITITDSAGCTFTTSTIITQPIPLIDSITTSINELCNGGNTGSATITSKGGYPAYTYLWSPGGQTTTNVTGLSAGTYTITVTDSAGCTATTTDTISEPPLLVVNIISSSNITCNGLNNGNAIVSASGGTSGYKYSWSPGGNTNSSISNLSVGTYTITIKDANGCVAVDSIVITQPAPFTSSVSSSTNVSCNGGSDGTATVTSTGGTLNYSYIWVPGGNTNAVATGLSAGTYSVDATDANGCTSSAAIIITQPPILNVIASVSVNVLCNGGNSGVANSNVTGGTSPYTYNWMPVGNTNANATGLSAGTYTLTVTDSNGCSATASVAFTQPAAIVATISSFTNVLCNGGTTGTASVSGTGGTPAYTYSWSPGGNTNANATGLSAGTYTITITDANGCTGSTTVILTEPPVLNASITSSTNLPCPNVNTGSATITAFGGTPAYTYLWSPGGQSTANITGLSAGNYTITVMDANGCSITNTITLTQPPLLTDSTSTTPTTCGNNSGTALVTVNGGTPIYQYLWSPGGNTSAFATGLSAGIYTITVTDANGCTATATAKVINTAPTLSTSTFVSCNGGSNGTATITIAGGTPPYTYLWTPTGQTNATATGLTAGTYTVSITDATGCNVIDSIVITQPTVLNVSISSSVNVLCNGGTTGSATSNASGGTPNYLYSWSPGGNTNANASGLSAGTYTLTVTDANGCVETASIVLTQPPPLSISIIASSNVSCNGGNNGSASVSGAGGTPAYTYLWAPGGASTTVVSGLTAGVYTITLKDSNGCIAVDSITITQPPLLTAIITGIQNVSCGGANSGAATVSAGGGTSPYTYLWTPTGKTTANATGLSAGTYTIEITDSNGCIASTSVSITQAAALTSTITTLVNLLCNGVNTGSASANVAGGTSPYTYSWSPGGNTNSNVTGLSAGTYTLYVKDSIGCTAGDTIILTQPPVLTATTNIISNVLCNGGSSGSGNVVASGGTSPYTYLWTPSGGTNSNVSGLSAGTYSISITDANGCTAVDSIIVTQPTVLTSTITSSVNLLCNGATTGSATASASGGTSPYTYNWTPSGGTNSIATGLSAGLYSITVMDANGCISTDTITLTQPPAITAAVSSTNANCGSANGTANVIAGGGTGAYTYLWSPGGGTTSNITGLSGGTYTIIITDANGCTDKDSIAVLQPTTLAISITGSTNVSCNGGSNGSATVSASGGTSPYTYLWSPTLQTNAVATGLTVGTYSIMVKDSFGCTLTASIIITQPLILTASISSSVNVLCNSGNNGSATVLVGGGTSPYTYAWTPNGGTNSTGTGLTAGTYTVNITDANGCIISDSIVITQPPLLTATIITTNITCNGNNNGSATLTASGGTSPYIYSWSPGGNSTTSISGLRPGTYTITITDANGCTASSSTTITQPAILSNSLSNTNVLCFGGNNASITANTSGGTIPYTYSWAPAAGNNSTLSNLTVGTYTVYISDSNNCSVIDSITITQPTALVVSATAPQIICDGTTTLIISKVSGGVMPYTYKWSTGATTANDSVSPTSVTSYKLTVTDANGCTATAMVVIDVEPPLTLKITGDSTVCPGHPVYIKATASGGDGIYHYLWTPGNSTLQWATFTVYSDTTVIVQVTDDCGTTTLTQTVTIHVDPVPNVVFNSNPTMGCFPMCVQFRDFSTIASGSITAWSWIFGTGDSSHQQNPIYCYRDSGIFTVFLSVASDKGCSAALKILDMIKVYAHPVASFTYSPQPVNIFTPLVQYTDKSTDQYSIVAWYWTFGDGSSSSIENPSHTFSDTGLFCTTLAITDEHGCADTTTECLDVEPMFTFYIPNAFTPNGDGLNDIFQPKGTYIRSYEMFIFDRWGSELYHTTDFYTGWNGEVNNTGQPCQEDTYVYLIYVFDSQGTKHTYTGKVNLIR